MRNRNVYIIILLIAVIGVVIFQQLYTDNAMSTFVQKSNELSQTLLDDDLDKSRTQAKELVEFWHTRELLISLFVDYRDIEQIGRQADYVLAYIESGDLQLAYVECSQLIHVSSTFHNIVKIDWHNIF